MNLLKWVCVIPGKAGAARRGRRVARALPWRKLAPTCARSCTAGTKWAAGAFPVTLNFTDDYVRSAQLALAFLR